MFPLAGCSGAASAQDEVRYCVTQDGVIIDQDDCDDDVNRGTGMFFFVHGNYGSNLASGTRIDTSRSNTPMFRTNDLNARSNAGFESGKVTTGKTVPGKPGGFGTGVGKPGGFGGGSAGTSGGG